MGILGQERKISSTEKLHSIVLDININNLDIKARAASVDKTESPGEVRKQTAINNERPKLKLHLDGIEIEGLMDIGTAVEDA